MPTQPNTESPNPFESLSSRTSCAIAFFLPVVLLLPFIGKAYHADDHVFVWVAEQIARAPFDFYGFTIDYGYAQTPIHEVFHSSPAVSYYLAAAGLLLGANGIAYHLAITLIAGLAGLGTYVLARDLIPRPLLATSMTILTPAFLVSASTLMADIPLIAAYVWAIYFWRRGIQNDRPANLLAAGLITALGVLIKYYALTLLPLLFVYALAIKKRPGTWTLYLLIPLIALAGLQATTYLLYEITPLTDATGIALADKWRAEEALLTRPLLTLIFLGGCLAPFALFLPIRASRKLHATTAALTLAISAPILSGYSALQLLLGTTDPLPASTHLHFALMLWLGLTLLILAARTCLVWKNPDALLLALWLFGTIAFTASINHYVNARTLLPMLPALAILIAYRLPKTASPKTPHRKWPLHPIAIEWRLIPACAFTLWTLVGDYEAAAHGKRAAQNAIAQAAQNLDTQNVTTQNTTTQIATTQNTTIQNTGTQNEATERDSTRHVTTLHHIAFWGAEYYLLKAGSKAFAFDPQENLGDPLTHPMNPGDLLFIHSLGAQAWQSPPDGFEIIEVNELPYPAHLATFYAAANAGFYSHLTGHLPYKIGTIPPEPFLLLKWTPQQQD